MEPDHRIQAIWTPARALPGSVVSDDDWPAGPTDDQPPPSAPSQGGAEYGPAGSQPREHRWYGANRWRNHWQDQAFDDAEPHEAAGREDSFGMPGPGDLQSDLPSDLPTRPQDRPAAPAAAAPRAGDDWPGDGLADDESFAERAYQGQTREEAWPGEGPRQSRAGRETGGQTRAPVASPGSGGTPLSWDEDE